ncbi:MAG TPA: hypothetical protein VMA34_10225 [Terracidiphilus sp.]|nr:hypothetical protein [Terracidiphilus sp.]
MDVPQPPPEKPAETDGGEASQGPSLVLIYSLVALAMLLATFFAAMIVLPFYLHR